MNRRGLHTAQTPQTKGSAIIAGFTWLMALLTPLVGGIVRKLWKLFKRFTTGQGELYRLLTSGAHSVRMSHEFSLYLRRSKQLGDVKNIVYGSTGAFNVQHVTTLIVSRKKISPSAPHFRELLLPNMIQSLSDLNGSNAVLGTADAYRRQKFDERNAEHVALLEELWSLLGDLPASDRDPSDWSKLGFQGRNPVTDFRGNGVLGLHNLVAIARTHNDLCRQVVRQADLPNALPLAITSINLTSFVLNLIEERLLERYFYGRGIENEDSSLGLDDLHHVFAQVFALLPHYYSASSPRDLMDFPPIFSAFQKAVQSSLEKTGLLPNSLSP